MTRLQQSPDTRAHRASLIAALLLAAIGIWRFSSDMLTDAAPGWHAALDGTWLRYTVRAPSDGTWVGNLNTQWFKLLSIPCEIAGLYLLKRWLTSDLREAQRSWSAVEYRAVWVGAFFTAATVMELEKAHHFLGLRMAGVLDGERSWLNHLAHVFSAVAAWYLARWLRMAEGPRAAEIAGAHPGPARLAEARE